MIEAMACGTPVIAWRNGSVPEVIEHGKSGFIVDNIDEAVTATRRISELSRRACRQAFELRFDVRRMARDYLDVYRRVQWDAGLSRPAGTTSHRRRPTAGPLATLKQSPACQSVPAAAVLQY
jgi:hypothetical protein